MRRPSPKPETPLTLAQLRKLHRPPERPWSEVFGNSGAIKGCTALHRHEPEEWKRIAWVCCRLGLPYKEVCYIAIMYPDVIRRGFAFLDGGVQVKAGPYWGGAHGACVRGKKTLRFLCYVLGLTQRERMPGEDRIPMFDELCLEIVRQRKGQTDELEDWVKKVTDYGS